MGKNSLMYWKILKYLEQFDESGGEDYLFGMRNFYWGVERWFERYICNGVREIFGYESVGRDFKFFINGNLSLLVQKWFLLQSSGWCRDDNITRTCRYPQKLVWFRREKPVLIECGADFPKLKFGGENEFGVVISTRHPHPNPHHKEYYSNF